MNKIELKIMALNNEILRVKDSDKTNHILHLILTILTGGFWLIVWILVAMSDNVTSKVNKIEKQINDLEELL